MNEFTSGELRVWQCVKNQSEDIKYQKAIRLLSELMGSMAVSIIEVIGSQATVGIMSRACKMVGIGLGKKIVNEYDIKGNDLITAMKVHRIIGDMVVDSHAHLVELTPTKSTVHVNRCFDFDLIKVFGNGTEKLFCEICRNYNEGVLQSVSPKAVFSVGKKISNGDKYCEFIRTYDDPNEENYKRNTPLWIPDPDQLSILPKKMKREMMKSWYQAIIAHMGVSIVRIIDLKPTMGIVGRGWQKLGHQYGEDFLEEYKITKNDMISAMLLGIITSELNDMISAMLLGIITSELFDVPCGAPCFDEEREECFWHSRCLFGDVLRELQTDVEASSFLCGSCNKYLQGLVDAVDPTYVLSAPKRQSQGYDYCEFRIKKGTVANAASIVVECQPKKKVPATKTKASKTMKTKTKIPSKKSKNKRSKKG